MLNMENQEQTIQKISNIFTETMQEMAFIDVAPMDKLQNAFSPEAIAVKIEVLMPYTGDLVIVFEKDLAKEFAVNVFGESQLSQLHEPVTDAASEFMNVIIGKIFAAFAPDLLFELGLPKLISPQIDASPYLAQHYVNPEGKQMTFYFRLDRLIAAFHQVK